MEETTTMRKGLVRRLFPIALITLSIFGAQAPIARAERTKVDCDAVMQEVTAGKTTKEIASDLKISVSSVHRCKRAAEKKAASQSGSNAASPAASPKP
jgi:DNA-binding NarL/FixJ family response regulator